MNDLSVLREWWPGAGRAWLSRLIDRVPSDCWLCDTRTRGGHLCPHCHQSVVRSRHSAANRCSRCCLRFAASRKCPDCAFLEPAFDHAIAAFDYEHPGDLLVGQFKMQHRFILSRPLGALLAGALHEHRAMLPTDPVVVPVPASRAALRQRGFNPAGLLGRHVAAALGWRYAPGTVRRIDGPAGVMAQKHLTRQARMRNVQGLFQCAAPVQGQHVVVVDDVMTTGSTLHAIAVVLKNAGAASVTGAVLARTPAHDRQQPA